MTTLGPVPQTRLSPSGIVLADGQAVPGIPIRISQSVQGSPGGAANVLTETFQRVGVELGDETLGILVEKAAPNVEYQLQAVVPTQVFTADATSAGAYEVAIYARVPTKNPVHLASCQVDVQDMLGAVQDSTTVHVRAEVDHLDTGSMGPSYEEGDDVEFYVQARIVSPNLEGVVRVTGPDDTVVGQVSLQLIELSR